jgi:hypothetical protein
MSLVPLGTRTAWGKVWAVGVVDGERYYWIGRDRAVAMIPGYIVEGVSQDGQAYPGPESVGPLLCPRCRDDLSRVAFHFHGV